MKPSLIAWFGEAEKGEYHIPYPISTLDELVERLGHPPMHSRGLFYAVQSLLFHHSLLFFRVKEEGFSVGDYLLGFKCLQQSPHIEDVKAIGVPGVGDMEVIEAITPIITFHRQILIVSEKDLYDYLSRS